MYNYMLEKGSSFLLKPLPALKGAFNLTYTDKSFPFSYPKKFQPHFS